MQARGSFACVVITGASAGLGAEFARQLAPRSARLVLVARRGELMDSLAAEIRAGFPSCEVRTFACDLRDGSAREALISSLKAEGHGPDLLINNAGLGDYGEFATAEWDKLNAMLQVNITALTHLAKAMLPDLIARKGAIINVSSLASLVPMPDFAVYAATKAYVTSFTEALRIEMKPHGVKVLALCPGPVKTEFGQVSRRGPDSPGMPASTSFYVPKEQVVAETLTALGCDCARVYPALKTALAARFIAATPLFLMRIIMGLRPRRTKQ